MASRFCAQFFLLLLPLLLYLTTIVIIQLDFVCLQLSRKDHYYVHNTYYAWLNLGTVLRMPSRNEHEVRGARAAALALYSGCEAEIVYSRFEVDRSSYSVQSRA